MFTWSKKKYTKLRGICITMYAADILMQFLWASMHFPKWPYKHHWLKLYSSLTFVPKVMVSPRVCLWQACIHYMHRVYAVLSWLCLLDEYHFFLASIFCGYISITCNAMSSFPFDFWFVLSFDGSCWRFDCCHFSFVTNKILFTQD